MEEVIRVISDNTWIYTEAQGLAKGDEKHRVVAHYFFEYFRDIIQETARNHAVSNADVS